MKKRSRGKADTRDTLDCDGVARAVWRHGQGSWEEGVETAHYLGERGKILKSERVYLGEQTRSIPSWGSRVPKRAKAAERWNTRCGVGRDRMSGLLWLTSTLS